MKVFVIIFISLGFLVVVFSSSLILVKKKIHYRYFEKNKGLAAFDYFTDYDGNWIFRKLEFHKILPEDKDSEFHRLVRQLAVLKKLTVISFIALILFGVGAKILNIV